MKYSQKLVNKICDYIRTDDFTRVDICKRVGISYDTFCTWKKTKPEFSDAIEKAEEDRLMMFKQIARKGLMELIQGKTVEEVSTEHVPNPSDPNKPKIKIHKVVKKYISPNPTAVIFTLKNTDPVNFADKSELQLNAGTSFLDLLKQTSSNNGGIDQAENEQDRGEE